ncbi:MAG: hypothetical protein QM619_10770 [Micropruina sp.]|uniref:hypothetical protein n=1 Tax=Micropruina sp. TaxID=2737536 RepID=UPI0039E2E4B2
MASTEPVPSSSRVQQVDISPAPGTIDAGTPTPDPTVQQTTGTPSPESPRPENSSASPPPGTGSSGPWPPTDSFALERGLAAMVPVLAGAVVVMGLTLLFRPPRRPLA